jgi:hypothetical protein
MAVATAEKNQSPSRNIGALKADLRQRFEAQLSRATEAVLVKVGGLRDDKALAALLKSEAEKQRSAETRSQASRARMIASAFARVEARCELLEASEAAEILGISKQALSQRTQAGQALAYTNSRRKYYPAFQFSDNKIKPVIGRLIKEFGIDPADSSAINFLIQHLVSRMDFSEPGEHSNVVARFELLDNETALKVIRRDYTNAF